MRPTTPSEEIGTPMVPIHHHTDQQNLSDATAHLIREEVRAVMREELRGAVTVTSPTTTLSPSPQKADAPPPPAYTSDAVATPRDETDDRDQLHSEAAHLLANEDPLGDVEASAATPAAARPFLTSRIYWALPGFWRLVIILLPLVAVFVLVPVLCTHGDILGLSGIALAMFLAQFGAFAGGLLIVAALAGFKDRDPNKSKPDQQANEGAGMFMTWYFFLSWGIFTLVLWLSLAAGSRTMLPRSRLAAEFDAKITQHAALEFVTRCLHEMIPNRNATIDDFTICFRKLGMPKTIIP